MATGWLVSKDLVVTAGHCAFDHSHGYGRLVKVKAYVGYTGKESIVSKYVEFRLGRAVATCPGWVDTDGGDERFDVSYIKLASPFKDVEHCFVPTPTPISKTAANLGVVGYPGDIANATGERGAMMYKMFAKTDYNLQVSDMHMLQYKIDTYGGTSRALGNFTRALP
jgi:V8-like Glu-specific endopeptidase